MRSAGKRRGFTLIELLTVLMFMLLVASMGLMRYIDLSRDAYTTQVSGDLDAVRVAALAYYGDHDAWPDTGTPGVAPPGMADYLPGNYVFNRPKWDLTWIHLQTTPNPTLGVLITSDDADMMRKLRQRFGTRFPFVDFGTGIMYMISTPDEGF